MNCVVIPNDSLPFVEIQGAIYCGEAYGSNEILRNTITPMLTHGTKMHDKNAFAMMLDDYALQYGVGTSRFSPLFVEWEGRSLPGYLPNLLEAISESLEHPMFEESELALEKKKVEAIFRQREYDLAFRAQDEGFGLLYGLGHPYYRFSLEELLDRLDKISSNDLRESWDSMGLPNGMHIVVVGPVDPDEIRSHVEQVFSWDNRVSTPPMVEGNTFAKFELDSDKEDLTVFVPDKSNVAIWVGDKLPINSADDNFPALMIANLILGGGSSARLFNYVREKKGLSYGVYSGIENIERTNGVFQITADTNPENVHKTEEAIFHVLDGFVSSGITQKELDRARAIRRVALEYRKSSFKGIAQREIITFVSGVEDFSEVMEQAVSSLTAEDVNEAIAEFIHPDEMKIVRAGTIT